jgi:hypothetical protein
MEVIFGVLGVSHFFCRVKSTIITSTAFHGFIRPGGKTVGMYKTLRRLPPVPVLALMFLKRTPSKAKYRGVEKRYWNSLRNFSSLVGRMKTGPCGNSSPGIPEYVQHLKKKSKEDYKKRTRCLGPACKFQTVDKNKNK